MSFLFDDTKRNVIPRWRDFETTAGTAELASSSKRPLSHSKTDGQLEARFDVLQREWSANHTLSFAGDFVGAALLLGRHNEIYEAAEFIIAAGDAAPHALLSLAHSILGDSDSAGQGSASQTISAIYQRIHLLRNHLIQDPRNAIALVDMARAYATIGQYEKACTAVDRALALQPDNRFVLRSAARLFIHTGKAISGLGHDIERAHYHLQKSRRTRVDPWLMAAEIATANLIGKRSRLISEAKRAVDRNAFSPADSAELCSALATQEISRYDIKLARSLFRKSLVEPTDNSVAQATWASKIISGIDVSQALVTTPRVFEANARSYYQIRHWEQAITECEKWLQDELYSTKSAQMGSFLASVTLGLNDRSIRITKTALQANPLHPGLLNNLVVALVDLNRLTEATDVHHRMRLDNAGSATRITIRATDGLLQFRMNNAPEGRRLYREAIANAKAEQNGNLVARALAHLAREEMLANTDKFEETYSEATEAFTHCPSDNAMQPFMERILAEFMQRRACNSVPLPP